MIIAYVSRSALAVPLALPEFIRTFHLSITDRGVLNSAFFWTYAVLQIPAGWVVDRYGVKFPYFLGFTIWCLASASTALTRSIPQLIVVQVLLGVGQAVVAPASYRWIRHHFVEKERGLAIASLHDGHQDRAGYRSSAGRVADRHVRLAGDVRADRTGRPDLAGALAPAGRRTTTGKSSGRP